jgi:hypothetical protein
MLAGEGLDSLKSGVGNYVQYKVRGLLFTLYSTPKNNKERDTIKNKTAFCYHILWMKPCPPASECGRTCKEKKE